MHQPLKDRDQSQSRSGRRDLPPPGQGAEGRQRGDDIITPAARGEGGSRLPAPLFPIPLSIHIFGMAASPLTDSSEGKESIVIFQISLMSLVFDQKNPQPQTSSTKQLPLPI